MRIFPRLNLDLAFSAQGISQVAAFLESFTAARVATFEALSAINRNPGSGEIIIYEDDDDKKANDTTQSNRTSRSNNDMEEGREKVVRAILPKYTINSTSNEGHKPQNVMGAISMKNVHFFYPTRPNEKILKGININISSGQTVALVGPSGGGKSTIVAMLERFYDPLSGSITLDGIKLQDYNVKHLRSCIGYVGQEPTLFATTIRGNIQYGNPDATEQQIIEAAQLANAHDFISAFPDGYNTQVGDKGSQLSGGQKQRIAIGKYHICEMSIFGMFQLCEVTTRHVYGYAYAAILMLLLLKPPLFCLSSPFASSSSSSITTILIQHAFLWATRKSCCWMKRQARWMLNLS
jgi:ATP-binding cassette, subfamily B (MDR/TAP), member 1